MRKADEKMFNEIFADFAMKGDRFEITDDNGDIWLYSPNRQIVENRLSEILKGNHFPTYFSYSGNKEKVTTYRIRFVLTKTIEVRITGYSRHNSILKLYRLGYEDQLEEQ